MRVLIIISLLFTTIASYSQDSTSTASGKSFLLGIEGGPSFCDMRGKDIKNDELKIKTFFSTGITAGYFFNPKFSLHTGIYYERKGAKWNFDDEDDGEYYSEIESWMRFDYLTLPLTFRYTLNGKINFHVNAGGYFSALMKQEYVYEFEDTRFSEEDKNEFSPFEFGITAGTGISKNLGSNFVVSAEVRDNLGLSDIFDPHETEDGYIIIENADELTLYTNSISVMFGVAYRIK